MQVDADQAPTSSKLAELALTDQAKNELKLFFTLAKYGEQHQIEVDESEVNGQIAHMAMMQQQRPEKMKQDMAKNGQLQDLWLSLRERKTLDKILEGVKIEDVAVEGDAGAQSVSPEAQDQDAPALEAAPAAEAAASAAEQHPASDAT